MRHWEPPVGPPPLGPPPGQPQRPGNSRSNQSSASGLSKNFENLSVTSSNRSSQSKNSSFSFGKKEGSDKKKLFKMKWGKD